MITKRERMILKGILFLFFVMVLTGCGLLTKTTPSNNKEVIVNDLFLSQQVQISSFDPLDAYHVGHVHVVKQIYNTLTDVDLSGNIAPSLAKSWNTADGITWVVSLKENILFASDECFQDTKERILTAIDVKYSFERLLHKDSKSIGVAYFSNITGVNEYRQGISNTIEGITVQDNNTIIFKLNEKDYSFPNLLSLPYVSIVKKQALEKYKNDFKTNPVGTGPFKLKTYEPNQKIVMLKNTDYWEKDSNGNAIPYIDGITISIVSDENTAFLMFKNRQINLLELSFPQEQQLAATKLNFNYLKDTAPWTQLNFYLFNLNTMAEKNIRQGINYAVNREKVQEILKEQGKTAHSLFPQLFKDLSTTIPVELQYAPDKAKTLLNQKMSLKLVCFDDLQSRALGEYLASELANYSIGLKIEAVPFPVLVERLTKGDYDIIQIYWGPFYADAGHFLDPFKTTSFPPSGNNFNKYSNPNFDRLLFEAKQVPLSEQKEKYLKAQEVILNDMPFLLMYFKNVVRVSDEKYEIPVNPLGYRFYKFAKSK